MCRSVYFRGTHRPPEPPTPWETYVSKQHQKTVKWLAGDEAMTKPIEYGVELCPNCNSHFISQTTIARPEGGTRMCICETMWSRTVDGGYVIHRMSKKRDDATAP